MNMLRNDIYFYVTLCLFAGGVNAFSVGTTTPLTFSSTTTQLSVSTTTHFVLDSECLLEAEYCVPPEQQQQQRHYLPTWPSTQQQQQATWIDLPRHSESSPTIDLELQMGRAAMVLALLLIVIELTTGNPFTLLGH